MKKSSRFNGKFFQFTELLFSAEITFLKTEKYGVLMTNFLVFNQMIFFRKLHQIC
jgi:hypothetical protein